MRKKKATWHRDVVLLWRQGISNVRELWLFRIPNRR